jgi:Spy/CpxP family protein refolding chaperone
MRRRYFAIALFPLFVINIAALATLSYNRLMRPKAADVQETTPDTWRDLQEQMLLRSDQIKKMQDLRLSFEEEIAFLRGQMQKKRNILVEETKKDFPDLGRIDSIIEEISGLQTKIEKKTVRNLIRDKELLTPQQVERYFSLFENHVRGQGMRVRGRGKGGHDRRW